MRHIKRPRIVPRKFFLVHPCRKVGPTPRHGEMSATAQHLESWGNTSQGGTTSPGGPTALQQGTRGPVQKGGLPQKQVVSGKETRLLATT